MTTPENARRGQRILVIDDEPVVCQSCARVLGAEGHEVDSRGSAREGLEAARTGGYDVILLDVVMPDLNGLDVLRRLRALGVASEVVIITGYSTVQNAVEAMKLGAADYLAKPFTPDELMEVLAKVLERSARLRELAALRREMGTAGTFEGILGASPAMERVFALLRRVGPTDGTVLLTGESGTGKEMAARALHSLSPRRDGPFVACDCSSLASTLLESELFGHVKGSFTGAVAAKQGLFEVATGGTLFLDEVANIGLDVQGKLLRVLETRQVRRVGDTLERRVDIRLVAATNRDLRALVHAGTFREDLYFRLAVVPVELPPLRAREGDVARLAVAFLERFQPEGRRRAFSPEALRLLEGYPWPGNVRELRNVVERTAILSDADIIGPEHLPREVRPAPPQDAEPPLPGDWETFKALKREIREGSTAELERRFLMQALARTNGNVTRAALDVGMQRTNFHALMRKHGLGSGEDDET